MVRQRNRIFFKNNRFNTLDNKVKTAERNKQQMRHLGFMFLLLHFYSQNKESTDSISYYTNLANVSVKENKYKDVLYFTQKAINYCDNNGKTEDQAIQTYNLGKIYYDLNRYTDARESFTESTSLFQSLQFNLPTPTIILAFPIVEKNTKQLKFL
jgi:tetratricopeptide (TPR) repeat protein